MCAVSFQEICIASAVGIQALDLVGKLEVEKHPCHSAGDCYIQIDFGQVAGRSKGKLKRIPYTVLFTVYRIRKMILKIE